MPNRGLSPLRMVRSGLCIGCGSCAAQRDPSRVRMELDAYGFLRPNGECAWLERPDAFFERTCPFSPIARNEDELARHLFPNADYHPTAGRFLSAYAGYAAREPFRANGSSGGMVSWVLAELLRRGEVDGVAHVAPCRAGERLFRYRISRTAEEVAEGAKSRYYPVEMSDVLREIAETDGRYAVVGVPCFIKAVQLLRWEDRILHERIACTLGLFCGHMKSAKFAESFALQMGIEPRNVAEMDFRCKDTARAANVYTVEFTLCDGTKHKRDWWNLAEGDWGAGFFQAHACNYCDDVIAETADVSFGDAWLEPYSQDGRGTNVVVVRSGRIADLLHEGIHRGDLVLREVDEDFVVATQAAGFRQRREGLAYRLTWPKSGILPVKRVSPETGVTPRRKLIYRSRAQISRWSHRVFYLASRLHWRPLYLTWARCSNLCYHGLAYSRGLFGRLADRLRLG